MDARCGGRSLFFFVCLFVFLTACNGFFSSGTAILFLLPFAKHVFFTICHSIRCILSVYGILFSLIMSMMTYRADISSVCN